MTKTKKLNDQELLIEATEMLQIIRDIVWEFETAPPTGKGIGFQQLMVIWQIKGRPLLERLEKK